MSVCVCCDKFKAKTEDEAYDACSRHFIVDQNRSISWFNGLSASIFNEYLMRGMNIIFFPPKSNAGRIWQWRVNNTHKKRTQAFDRHDIRYYPSKNQNSKNEWFFSCSNGLETRQGISMEFNCVVYPVDSSFFLLRD